VAESLPHPVQQGEFILAAGHHLALIDGYILPFVFFKQGRPQLFKGGDFFNKGFANLRRF
jgi:hypothetical protein